MTKVIEVSGDGIKFDNGLSLTSYHDQSCCESHYLDFSNLSLNDFEGLEFNLEDGENWFTRVEDYGIALNPVMGFPVRIPGYGYNNGYYSHELTLILGEKRFDITERQKVEG